MAKVKGTIGILTGGGDVPGLNPAIRAVTVRALREGYRVIGIRRGWAGIVDLVPDKKVDNSEHIQELTEEIEITVVHEVAHHFGIDDDALRRESQQSLERLFERG